MPECATSWPAWSFSEFPTKKFLWLDKNRASHHDGTRNPAPPTQYLLHPNLSELFISTNKRPLAGQICIFVFVPGFPFCGAGQAGQDGTKSFRICPVSRFRPTWPGKKHSLLKNEKLLNMEFQNRFPVASVSSSAPPVSISAAACFSFSRLMTAPNTPCRKSASFSPLCARR